MLDLLRDVDTTGADIYFWGACLEGSALEASHADDVGDTAFPILQRRVELFRGPSLPRPLQPTIFWSMASV